MKEAELLRWRIERPTTIRPTLQQHTTVRNTDTDRRPTLQQHTTVRNADADRQKVRTDTVEFVKMISMRPMFLN